MKKHYPKEVFLNDRWIPASQATVSVFDRGFLLGDGIYEVIPFYRGKLFTLDEHLSRLQTGLTTVGMAYHVDQLRDTIAEAIARIGHPFGTLYIQITRGAAPRTHYFPDDAVPTVLLYASPFVFEGFEKKVVDVILSEDFRWHRCNIKSISLMANVLANNTAHQLGVAENVFHRGGYITEGSHTSIFFVREGVLFTHPEGEYILPGITRAVVLDIAKELGIEVCEEAVSTGDLLTVSETFLTGTTAQITAIGSFQMGGETLQMGEGYAGPVTRQIQQAFIKRVNGL